MYALIDSNNFFVSCERLFRPDLENTPVIVLSSNDGCAISRSAEAKALGVKMGEPIFKLRQRFRVIDGNLKRELRDKKYEIRREIMPRSGSQKVASGDIFSTLNSYLLHHNSAKGDLVAFSANFELYGDISERITTTLTSITPHIELYSIDEAFLDLTQLDIPDYTAWGAKLRALILQNIGIPVSVGIASTKTLCKLANHHAKTHKNTGGVWAIEVRDKRYEIRDEAIPLCGQKNVTSDDTVSSLNSYLIPLTSTSIADVWGVGWRLAPKLRAEGVFTALDLARLRPQRAGQLMGVHGRHMVYELNGTRCLPLQARTKPQQMISRGRQFGRDTSDLGVVTAAVTALANRAARELRREGQLATHAIVTLRTNRLKPGYTCIDSSARFYAPTADTGEICSQLIRTLQHSLQPKLSYHKAEVTLYGLVSSSVIQTDVFGMVDLSKLGRSQRRMAAVDAANAKYGPHAIRPAAELLSDAWRPKSAMLSPRYTSSWNELPEVVVAGMPS
jgi:DNA polymerase V